MGDTVALWAAAAPARIAEHCLTKTKPSCAAAESHHRHPATHLVVAEERAKVVEVCRLPVVLHVVPHLCS